MKKIAIITILAAIIMAGCTNPMGGNPKNLQTGGRSITIASGSNSSSLSDTSRSLNVGTENISPSRVYFRSSDIEFWSISDSMMDNLDTITSYKFQRPDSEDAGISTEVKMVQTQNSIVFVSGYYNEIKADDTSTATFDFSKKYNLIRIDIGCGKITVDLPGRDDIEYHNAVVPDSATVFGEMHYYYSGIPGNSILLIGTDITDGDTTPVLITRIDKKTVPTNINIKAKYRQALTKILQANVDIDGALVIPFNPTDLSTYNNITDLKIRIDWDILNSFVYNSEEEKYYMANRVNGTCYNFMVNFEVTEGTAE